jgi:hypothetical protein
MYSLTFIVIDWDGPKIRDILSRKIYKDIVIESLKFCQNQKESILYIITPPILNLLAKNEYDIGIGLWQSFTAVGRPLYAHA